MARPAFLGALLVAVGLLLVRESHTQTKRLEAQVETVLASEDTDSDTDTDKEEREMARLASGMTAPHIVFFFVDGPFLFFSPSIPSIQRDPFCYPL